MATDAGQGPTREPDAAGARPSAGKLLAIIGGVVTLLTIVFSVTIFGHHKTYRTYRAQTLDAEDRDWRNNTILVLDGASYHRGSETTKALAALKVPTMISGPYGYDAAPAEKLFALLKRGDLNPDCIKTGKR